jgi:hypothetical protein
LREKVIDDLKRDGLAESARTWSEDHSKPSVWKAVADYIAVRSPAGPDAVPLQLALLGGDFHEVRRLGRQSPALFHGQ